MRSGDTPIIPVRSRTAASGVCTPAFRTARQSTTSVAEPSSNFSSTSPRLPPFENATAIDASANHSWFTHGSSLVNE